MGCADSRMTRWRITWIGEKKQGRLEKNKQNLKDLEKQLVDFKTELVVKKENATEVKRLTELSEAKAKEIDALKKTMTDLEKEIAESIEKEKKERELKKEEPKVEKPVSPAMGKADVNAPAVGAKS